MGRIKIVVLLLLCTTGHLRAQNRYMVFFRDKTGTPFLKADSLSFLSQRAIERRTRQDIGIKDRDLPVNPAHVQGVRDLDVETFFTTKWMNGVLVQCDPGKISAIEALAFVDHTTFVAPGEKLANPGRKKSSGREKDLKAESTLLQRQMIGLDDMHANNIHGEGKIIAVMDGGFPGMDTLSVFRHVFEGNRVMGVSHDFVHNTRNVFQYDDHGTQVISVMAGLREAQFVGGAYEATYQLYVTEDTDSEYRIEEYNWLFAAERADSSGADVINTSLGYYDFDDPDMNYSVDDMNGNTTVISRAAQVAAESGMIVVCAAGNEGAVPAWRIISAPADAKDVVAVGGVDASENKTFTSSIGPTADNRIKPDLAALGQNVSVVRRNGNFSNSSGTSVAAPLITSLMAGVWQRYPYLTAKEVIDVVKKTASRANNPDVEIGYGIPDFEAIMAYLEPVIQESPFVVFPNPVVQDIINIRPSDPEQYPSCRVELLSMDGRVLAKASVSFDLSKRTHVEDVSQLADGLYMLRILSADNRRFTFKIVKR